MLEMSILRDKGTPLQKKFGEIVREKRLSLKMTQEVLAARANFHFTYISSVERGLRNITLGNIEKLAIALKCTLKDIMPDHKKCQERILI
jgi:transcriptional regulator with XRE-family HTH domain